MTSLTYVAIRSIHADHIQSELVSNGDFSSGSAGWTATDWAVTTVATHNTGNTTALLQALSGTLGYTYDVTVTTSGRTAGSVTPYLGTQAGSAISTNTTETQSIVFTGNLNLSFVPTSDFDGAVDDISVIVTGSWGMDIIASSLGEKWPVKKNTHTALDNTTETIFHRRDRVFDYSSDLISNTDLTDAYWCEMLDSILGGETFTFDYNGSIATPVSAGDAIMVGEPRYSAVGALFTRVSFTVKML